VRRGCEVSPTVAAEVDAGDGDGEATDGRATGATL
jgi:hypothetical protein